jgi:Flp pilus assembly protein TadG
VAAGWLTPRAGRAKLVQAAAHPAGADTFISVGDRMRRRTHVFGSDRGAVLIHVAFAILALIAFTTFVVDWGVLWLSRRQAQNSADAGALAGAIALAFDDSTNFTVTGQGKLNAHQATQANLVYGQAPSVNIATDITIPPSPFTACPNGLPCIRVDVYRNQARGNALPIMFGTLVGLTDQGIQATATAQIQPGNASNCLKPWAVPDKWLEVQTPAWDPTDTFDKYDKDYSIIANPDVYVPPSPTSPGTGYTLAADGGTELTLKDGSPQAAIRPGWFFPVVLTTTGGSVYESHIPGCAPVTYKIGDVLTVEPGNMIGPTAHGTQDLIDLDPLADWDPGSESIIGGCMAAHTCTMSPRVVDLTIVNFLGFFVDRVQGNDVIGYLLSKPLDFDPTGGTVDETASFGKKIFLVR